MYICIDKYIYIYNSSVLHITRNILNIAICPTGGRAVPEQRRRCV